jgi:putative thioredoxin
MDVNERDFDDRVIARSSQVPVVVDFWAPWCAPCRVLAPALEAEVAALGGRVELVKVNVDENPMLSQAFSIRGIPALKAFRERRVVAELEGAHDRPALRRWLESFAPSPSASKLAMAGQDPAALRLLLDDPEVGRAAAVALASALLDAGQPGEVPGLLALAPDDERVPLLERRLAFAADAAAGGGEAEARAAVAARPDDLDARWALASALAARGAWAEALEELLSILTRSRRYREDGARRAMLAIFETLGRDSDLARDFRRRLQIVT